MSKLAKFAIASLGVFIAASVALVVLRQQDVSDVRVIGVWIALALAALGATALVTTAATAAVHFVRSRTSRSALTG